LFLALAVIQFNDPDPLYWVVVYGWTAGLPIAAFLEWRWPAGYWVAVGLGLAGLLHAGPGFLDYLASGEYGSVGESMEAAPPYVESAREFLGLLMAAVCLGVYRRWHRTNRA
jgi:hypothetical protein